MSRLHDLLTTQRAAIMQRWTDQVRGTLHPESMPRLELVDHLPMFLDEIVAAIAEGAGLGSSATAAEHGLQRLQLGFSLDGVVREYGALRTAIFAAAEEAGVNVSFHESQIVFDCVITGIADAVSEYARQRDAEIQRQSTEHFAFIAHELRNPLSSALLGFRLLQTKGLLSATERSVGVVERSLGRMHDLIEQSLEAARLGAGLEVHPERVHLRTLLEEVELSASIEAEARKIRIEVQAEGEEEIEVDSRLVLSALSNLVRNAVKFSKEHGVVTMRSKVENGHATIEVEDCCGGLSEGATLAAFAPFTQFGGRDQTGFGLGLAIAKQAGEAHGGSLRLQNLPGKGCIFILDVPAAAAAAH